MKSDVIRLDNRGNGIEEAKEETRKIARFRDLTDKESLQLQLCAEEMLCLARSVTGEMLALFWIESTEKNFELHMTTHTVMDKTKREQLIEASSERKNEAAKTFLGRIRNAFEEAMLSENDDYSYAPDMSQDDSDDLAFDAEHWEQCELSVLRSAADSVKVSITGRIVDLTVVKNF